MAEDAVASEDVFAELTGMRFPGVAIELEEARRAEIDGMVARLPAGGRLLLRVTLRHERAAAPRIVAEDDGGRLLGRLPQAESACYAAVLAEISRRGRTGQCSGYLSRASDRAELRLLLHAPEECLRRVEVASGGRSVLSA